MTRQSFFNQDDARQPWLFQEGTEINAQRLAEAIDELLAEREERTESANTHRSTARLLTVAALAIATGFAATFTPVLIRHETKSATRTKTAQTNVSTGQGPNSHRVHIFVATATNFPTPITANLAQRASFYMNGILDAQKHVILNIDPTIHTLPLPA